MVNALHPSGHPQETSVAETMQDEFDRQNDYATICENALKFAERKSQENEALRNKIDEMSAAHVALTAELKATRESEQLDYKKLASMVVERLSGLEKHVDQSVEAMATRQFLNTSERLDHLQDAIGELTKAKAVPPEIPDLSKLGQVLASLENAATAVAVATQKMARLSAKTERKPYRSKASLSQGTKTKPDDERSDDADKDVEAWNAEVVSLPEKQTTPASEVKGPKARNITVRSVANG